MFAGKQVGKIYYGGQLVYQNVLPAGTVLWSGNRLCGKYSEFVLPLEHINSTHSNLKSGLIFSYELRNPLKQFNEKIAFENVFGNMNLYGSGHLKMSVSFVENEAALHFLTDSDTLYLTKITVT